MITYKKVGGLHHWKIGRLGGSFYLKRAEPKTWDGGNEAFINTGCAFVAAVTAIAVFIA